MHLLCSMLSPLLIGASLFTPTLYIHGLLNVKPGMVQEWAMAKEDPYFRLRVPEELKAQIEKSAAANNRSMTSEIISRLERSYLIDVEITDGGMALTDHEHRLEKIEDRMARMEDYMATMMGYKT